MSSLCYALNIATLAIWLSVVGLDVVGWVLPIWHAEPKSSRTGETVAILTHPEISLGAPEETLAGAEPAEPSPDAAAVAEPEPMPEPPEIPAIAELAPLPELPEWPLKRSASSEISPRQAPAAQPTRRTEGQPSARTAAAAAGAATALSASTRSAAGQMPPPIYPAEARRKGQTGTVLVEFMVGADGRVLSAFPREPSPWPLLNNEAVRTVRRWKFPPGAVMKLQRPIVFQLK
jgi:protein TonB